MRGVTAAAKAKGRPLGYLVAWLGQASNWTSKQDHWKPENQPAFADRQAARVSLANMEAGHTLLEKERPKHDDEGSEPEGLA